MLRELWGAYIRSHLRATLLHWKHPCSYHMRPGAAPHSIVAEGSTKEKLDALEAEPQPARVPSTQRNRRGGAGTLPPPRAGGDIHARSIDPAHSGKDRGPDF